MKEIYDSACKNSLERNIKNKRKDTIRLTINVKRAKVASIALASTIFIAATVTNAGIGKIADNVQLSHEYSQYTTIISKNTHPTSDGQNLFYYNDKIADSIVIMANEDGAPQKIDYDMEILKTYLAMKSMSSRNELANMDEVMTHLAFIAKDQDITLPSTFAKHVISLGYEKKDGSPDYKKYEKVESEILLLQAKLNKALIKRSNEKGQL